MNLNFLDFELLLYGNPRFQAVVNGYFLIEWEFEATFSGGYLGREKLDKLHFM